MQSPKRDVWLLCEPTADQIRAAFGLPLKEEPMRHAQECPACGVRLVVVGEDLLTLDEALADEIEGRLDREWERAQEDEAPER